MNSEINVEMGNQASGPKRRPEISAGTLTRPKGPSSTGGLRLPIPNDDELEKRYKIFLYFAIKPMKGKNTLGKSQSNQILYDITDSMKQYVQLIYLLNERNTFDLLLERKNGSLLVIMKMPWSRPEIHHPPT